SAEFTFRARVAHDDVRAEANRIVIAAYGERPALRYVEPGLPFPPHVPVRVRYPADDDSPEGWW
ncbi:MAG TPA: hypothetical protein VHT74_33725, partial [Acetobacteraceae bacterium]|nr:hypothetical protein [Acetobacteraceae bacterium]